MGEVTKVARKHFTGLDADKPNVAGQEVGDTYTSTDTKKRYAWDGTKWNKLSFVPREISDKDFTQGDAPFVGNIDGNWHNDALDLSGIVPAGAVAVCLELVIRGNAADLLGQVRKDAAWSYNRIISATQVANVVVYTQSIVMIDSDRLMDFSFDVGITALFFTVTGWFF